MKLRYIAATILLMLSTNQVWAYGSSSSTKACTKPKFSEFKPADKAEVTVGSEFSFTASANTSTRSLKVTVKDTPVEVKITPQKDGELLVTGVLPASITDTFARISISAETTSQCKGNGGWLLKIKPSQ